MDQYADLTILETGARVVHSPETLRRDFSEIPNEYVICNKPNNGLGMWYWRWLLAGKILVLVVGAITLVSLYLQVTSLLLRHQEERDELYLNQSRCLEELEDEQELTVSLRGNLTSLERHQHHHQVYNQQEMESKRQQCEDINSKYRSMQQEYDKMGEKYLIVPREHALLKDCQMSGTEANSLVCPFCPPGWQLFAMSCYLLSLDYENWVESSIWCREQGGHLAVINSEQEQKFLQGLVTERSWIGLTDRDIEGQWHWVDGTPYSTNPKFWSSKQPDNSGNEDCVTLSSVSQWTDEKCRRSLKSICECSASQFILQDGILSN
ncbi:uncharacterized protein O3C94_023193 [Discoglossus pictus]